MIHHQHCDVERKRRWSMCRQASTVLRISANGKINQMAAFHAVRLETPLWCCQKAALDYFFSDRTYEPKEFANLFLNMLLKRICAFPIFSPRRSVTRWHKKFHFLGERSDEGNNEKFSERDASICTHRLVNCWKFFPLLGANIHIRKHTFFMYVQLLMMINGPNLPCSNDEDYNVAFLRSLLPISMLDDNLLPINQVQG